MMKKTLLFFNAVLMGFNLNTLSAQEEPISPSFISNGTFWGETAPLSSLPVLSEGDWKQLDIKFKAKELNKKTGERPYPFQATALPQGPDEAWQKEMGSKAPLAPILNFAGQGSNAYPTDPNGDVNEDYYFQTINSIYSIYNKSGVLVAGPTNINLLFGSVPGSNCNDGDPIVLWDEAAARWLVAEFSLCNTNDRMLIAVSTTSNPTGTWYQYSFDVADVPDYEKFGVWRDGYYMGTNNSGGNDIYVFQRDQMLIGGASPQMVGFDNAWRPASGFHCVPPVDNDGTLAPSGTPGYFITINNDAWGGADELWIYQLAVNWTTPASSTFTRTQQLAVTPFDNNFGAGWSNIYQQGTAQRLDAVLEVLMQRPQYKNYGSYQTIVCCHTVDVDNTDHAGIRWYELRRTTGNWSIRQTGTYAPDAHSRWMGSIALNGINQIAMGYSISSSSMYPGIRYCGQSAAAYAAAGGVMDVAEEIILTGSASQTSSNRWGDYTMIAVDPSDNQTFWYTNQYFQSSSPVHPTRIASFRIDPYCAASGGCDEYISRVQLGTIDNATGCTNYGDYTGISTNLGLLSTNILTVTNGTPLYSADQCGVWIDWNRDFDFTDANETIAVSGTPGVGPYTASITPPSGATAGETRMRVRITYTGAVDPCGTTQYGEVEDYTINLIDYCAAGGGCDEYISRVQFGTIDNITSCSGYGNYNYLSANLGLSATKTLTVTNGNPVYYSDQCGVWIDWNRDNDFYDANETITVSGTPGIGPYTASVTPPAGTTSGVVRMRIRITYSGSVDPCGTTTYGEVEDYSINLIGPNYWVGGYNHYWHQAANWSAGHIPTEDEDVIINNTGYQPVYVDNYPGFTNEACYNLGIGAGASVEVWDMMLNINGSLNISGALSMTDAAGVINIRGNWNNYAGAPGFTEGPGRVVFNGDAGHQYCTTENFNILEINKAAGAFRPYNGENISCAAYDWTSGALDVIIGSFTASDLLDNGLYGAYYCNSGGIINLNNLLDNTWVDLNCEMHIYGGTVNVSGSISDWPFAADALLEMTDGVLDFKTCGININNTTFSLNDNITGGKIRTAYGFSGNRADFTPVAGTFELYGSSDVYISQTNGCTLWNVNIDKSAKKETDLIPDVVQTGERIDKTIANNGKSNTVYPLSNFIISNNLTVMAGTLDIGSYTVSVAKSAGIYGTLAMTNSSGVFNVGTADFDFLWFYTGSYGNLTAGTINLPYALITDNGSMFNATTGHTINFLPVLSFGGLANYESATIYGNINVNMNGGSWILDPSSTAPFEVAGDFTVNPGNTMVMYNNTLHMQGQLIDNTTSALHLNDGTVAEDQASLFDKEVTEKKYTGAKGGSLEIETDFDLTGYLNVADGNALVHGIFYLAPTGYLNITTGSFIADSPLHAKGWEYIDGHLTLTTGLFEITHNSINFSASGTSTVSGGTVRTGEAFGAVNPGNFQPTGGTVEFTGVGQNTLYCSNGNYFYNLLINRDPSAGTYLYSNIQVNNNLTINSGNFYLGNSPTYYSATVSGGVTVNGGNLYIIGGSTLSLAGGTTLSVNSGGKINVIGFSGLPSKVSRISSGYYNFNVQSGGTIAAQYGTFEYMSTSGINLLSGSLVDPVYSFNYCTFQNGQSAGRLMTIENNQVFNAENTVFPANTWSGSYNVYKAANAGTVNFITATGGFAGESFDYDPNNRVNWTGRLLSLKAFMEGAFNGTNMNTTLNAVLPLSHPFNVTLPYFGGTPKWYYTGAGSVGAIPNTSIVDWVLLDIRDAVSAVAATGATSVAKIPAFILNNGSIVALNGSSNPEINTPIVNNLYVVVFNRNHEGIMNANTISYASGTYTYDYSTGSGQVFGGTNGHKLLGSGIWGMRSGDGNGDGSVAITDKTSVWSISTQLGKTGYLPSDFNFDRQTNNKDKNDKWKPNLGTSSQVPN